MKKIYKLFFDTTGTKIRYLLGFLTALGAGGIEILLSVRLGKMVDLLKATFHIKQAIVTLVLLTIGQILLTILSQYMLTKIGMDFFKSTQEKLLGYLFKSKLQAISRLNPTEWGVRLVSDLSILREFMSEKVPEVLVSFLEIMIVMSLIIYFDWLILVPIVIVTGIVLACIVVIGNKIDRVSESRSQKMTKLAGDISENMTLIKTIKNYQQEDNRLTRIVKSLKEIYTKDKKMMHLFLVSQPITGMFPTFVIISIVLLGIKQISEGSITVGNYLIVIFLLMELIPKIVSIISFVTEVKEVQGRVQTTVDFVEQIDLEEDVTAENSIINHVSFGQVNLALSDKALFQPVSFDAQKGQVVLIKGQSGIGKSMLLENMLGYVDNFKGSIHLGAKNLRDYSSDTIRQQIKTLFTANDLFSGTISDNLFSYDDATAKRIKSVTSDSFIHFALEHPDYEIGEMGDKISTGQKQKLKILRLLLSPHQILLLDEPTNGLDDKSVAEVHKLIKSIKDKIIIIVSHQKQDEVLADEIVLLQAPAT